MLSTVYPDSVLMLEKSSTGDEERMSGSEAMGGQRVVVSCWVTAGSELILLQCKPRLWGDLRAALQYGGIRKGKRNSSEGSSVMGQGEMVPNSRPWPLVSSHCLSLWSQVA